MIDYYTSKEPWSAVQHQSGSDDGEEAFTIWPQGTVVNMPEGDAERMVACVNALHGLDPAALPALLALCERAADADESLVPADFHLALEKLRGNSA